MQEKTLGKKTITVRALTVREVAEFLGEKTPPPPTCAELLLNRDLPERVVRTATGLTTEDLNGDADPAELDCLWQAVEDENPFLLRLHLKLKMAATQIRQRAEAVAGQRGPQPISEESPASSSGSDTPE